jgi:hypothetical protein
MPRTPAHLGSGARVYPASLIGELLDASHGNSRRTRRFPATAVAHYYMALSLYHEAAYADVFDAVARVLAWRSRVAVPPRMKPSFIRVARSRLSWPLFRHLQKVACPPLVCDTTCPQAFYRGLSVMAIDGSNFDASGEPENL